MTNDIYIILIFFCIMFVNNDCLFYTCVSLLCQVSEGPIPMTHVVYIKGDELIGWTNQTILQCSSVMLFFFGIDFMETPAKKLKKGPDVSQQKENYTFH